MKRNRIAFIFIFVLIAGLLLGLYACDDTPEPTSIDLEGSAAALTEAAIPGGSSNGEISQSILSALRGAGVERADQAKILLALTPHAREISEALTSLYTKEYDDLAKDASERALYLIAESAGPDVAGDLYYYVTSSIQTNLPYTASDCRKAANLYFGLYQDLGESPFAVLNGEDLPTLGAREINTALLSLASSLRSVAGLSQGAKDYLQELLGEEVNELATSSNAISAHQASAFLYIQRLVGTFFEGYDSFLSFAAECTSRMSAETVLGVQYEKREVTRYYGYNYEWTSLPSDEYTRRVRGAEITLAEYTARDSGYDEYIAMTELVSVCFVDGDLRIISDEDVALADEVNRLRVLYSAYAALTREKKSALKERTEDLFTVLAEEPLLASLLFDREVTERDDEAPTATFDELMTALSPLGSFDAKDGIDETERGTAESATETFRRFMHGYFPNLY